MDLIGWWVIVPLAVGALVTGIVMSLGTLWGLFRHYWVLISLLFTILCTVVLVVHMPSVSATAGRAYVTDPAQLRALGGDLFHPGVGLLVLLAITVLNVYKPAGLTAYGWRKQRERRLALEAGEGIGGASPVAGGTRDHRQNRGALAGLMSFVFHLAEMAIAMLVGMMVFMPVRLALTGAGYTSLLDATSIDSQLWMAAFMVVPMAIWMRVRGCRWRLAVEMSIGMLLPICAAVVARALGPSEALSWLANSEHALMLVGMILVMLYRRDHCTRGYSLDFGRTPQVGIAEIPARTRAGIFR